MPKKFELGKVFMETSREWKSSDFKADWTCWEHFGVVAHLKDQLKEYYGIRNAEDLFGLPYTSSGTFAAVWNTNDNTFLDDKGNHVEGFALTKNNVLIAIFQDDNENVTYYAID